MQWSNTQRESFKEALREFKEQVDAIASGDATMETKPLKTRFDSILGDMDKPYECHVRLGSGNLADTPSLNFIRKDILGAGFVNGEKFSQQKGVYIYFGYGHKEKIIYLGFGFPEADIEKSRCPAVNAMESRGDIDKYSYEFENMESSLDVIVENFLAMVAMFDSFDSEEFRQNYHKDGI